MVEHQLEEVTLRYLLVTEARLAMHTGRLDAAAEAIEKLRRQAVDPLEIGERHAADRLAAALELRRGDPVAAERFARDALAVEPLRIGTRWFSSIEVIETLATSVDRMSGDASGLRRDGRTAVDRFLQSVPSQFVPTSLLRRDVASLIAATGG